jgi:putative flavoprotein involved in K+ transport
MERAEMTVTAESAPATTTVAAWLSAFGDALSSGDPAAAAALFAPECYWRDLVAFTWNIKTMEGRDEIAAMLQAVLPRVAPDGWRVTPGEEPAEAGGVTEAWIDFETAVGRGHGHLRLAGGQCWTLLTTLQELAGHEEPRGLTRPKGVRHGADPGRVSWREHREQEEARLGVTEQPYVVIVGGGQGGIALGARLRQLGVPAIILDRHGRPGDQWRSRYKSLCLHDPVWYDHLPYLKFPDNWPVFSPKDKIADWLESYTTLMELTWWGNSVATSAAYDEAARRWTVQIERDGQPVVLRPAHLVMATGVSGKPSVPRFPGMDVFEGDQHHSSAHPGPDGYRGRTCVVVGSNNSAFDICGALWEAGAASVTMVQRSSSHIVKSDALMEIGVGALYSEQAVAAGMTTEKADLVFASLPYRIMHQFQIPLYEQMKERDRDFYERLETAGFEHDWGDDGSGLFMKYLRRGSGYYIDVGAADLVASGDVHLAHGQVDHLTPDAVVLADGTELPADLVVYATGYGSMNGFVADLISPEVAAAVGKCWGLGSDTTKDPGPWEGEQRNMWKPTRQEALWFHGGNLAQSRHYSLVLALQLKARQVGIPTPVYGLQAVHHQG